MSERLMVDISLELSALLTVEGLVYPDVRCRLNNYTDDFEARVYAPAQLGAGYPEVVLYAGSGATAEAAMESLIVAVKSVQAARELTREAQSLGLYDEGGEG